MIKELHIWSRIQHLVSLLMVTLLLSISAIQLFHSHDEERQRNKTGAIEYNQAIEKCQVCDFLAHIQQKELLVPAMVVMPLLLSFFIAQQVSGTVNFYKFTLSGFTNKGPPCVSAFS